MSLNAWRWVQRVFRWRNKDHKQAQKEIEAKCRALEGANEVLERDLDETRKLLLIAEEERRGALRDAEKWIVRAREVRLKELVGDSKLYQEVEALIEKAKRRAQTEELIKDSSLPAKSVSQGGISISYEAPFRRTFKGLEEGERKRVQKALLLMSTRGPNHPSLGTVKNRWNRDGGIEEGSFMSRASRDWRILWKVADRTLVILNLFNRSDSRLPYKSA